MSTGIVAVFSSYSFSCPHVVVSSAFVLNQSHWLVKRVHHIAVMLILLDAFEIQC